MNPPPGKRPPRKPWPSLTDDSKWRTDLSQIPAHAAESAVWLRMHGVAEPVQHAMALSLEKIDAMGVYAWAPCLVTDNLSEREMRIFMNLANGAQVCDIAAGLHLCVKTVSTYRTRVIEKTGLRNNVEMAIYAYRAKLIEWPRLPRPAETAPAQPPEAGAVPHPPPAREAAEFFGGR